MIIPRDRTYFHHQLLMGRLRLLRNQRQFLWLGTLTLIWLAAVAVYSRFQSAPPPGTLEFVSLVLFLTLVDMYLYGQLHTQWRRRSELRQRIDEIRALVHPVGDADTPIRDRGSWCRAGDRTNRSGTTKPFGWPRKSTGHSVTKAKLLALRARLPVFGLASALAPDTLKPVPSTYLDAEGRNWTRLDHEPTGPFGPLLAALEMRDMALYAEDRRRAGRHLGAAIRGVPLAVLRALGQPDRLVNALVGAPGIEGSWTFSTEAGKTCRIPVGRIGGAHLVFVRHVQETDTRGASRLIIEQVITDRRLVILDVARFEVFTRATSLPLYFRDTRVAIPPDAPVLIPQSQPDRPIVALGEAALAYEIEF
ncbi:hypothetical protein A9404_04030 [Halothiobacillus diazotrophicus]|uniref:Uncharacterized protein n=1 Tax=Halothiobacillus diazotrophicus TaxID=1860122 RepID=A0A191ZFK1_9GAMM|nr:hypothetical protein [Halothiobacillus diazotrophicus]ANJ66656.1 hypothetical protein A9404_04030 [Halothiobacillus diazotrophicus]